MGDVDDRGPVPLSEASPDAERRAWTSRTVFLLLLALGISALFFAVIRGYVLALVMAAVLASVATPAYKRIGTLLGGRQGLAAILTVVLLLGLLVVPILFFLHVLWQDAARTGEVWGPQIADTIQDPDRLAHAIEEHPELRQLLPYQDEIVEKVTHLGAKAASIVANAAMSGISSIAAFFLMLYVTLYGTFFFLQHGRRLIDSAFDLTPLSAEDRESLVATFVSVSRATLKGTILIGLIQGALAGAAFAVAGLEGAVFWGAVMAVLSILPGIGSALVWVPAVIYLALTGNHGAAVGVGIWCAVVVGTIDNFLRPALVGRDTKMPDLIIFVTTLGGLAMFGASGIVLGPLVGALFTTIWLQWRGAAGRADAARDAGQPLGDVT